MRYLLDTNICVFFLRGRINLDEIIKEKGRENRPAPLREGNDDGQGSGCDRSASWKQVHKEQHDRNDKQHVGDVGRHRRNAGDAEDTGNQRDDEKH